MKRKRSNEETVEFLLAAIIAILLIASLLSQNYFNIPFQVISLIILAFILSRVYHIVKKGGTVFEDYISLTIIILFLIINIILKENTNPIITTVMVLVLLYSVGLIPSIKYLGRSRSVTSFIISYLIFIIAVIFLFSGAFIANNSQFIDSSGEQTIISFEDSLYFSTMTFTTVGYGDISPLGTNKVISSIEAILAIALNIAFIGYILASRRFKSNKLT